MKRVIAFLRLRCAGWRGRAPLGVGCRPRTGSGIRSIAGYAHGCNQGVWPRLMTYLRAELELSAVLPDSTVVRMHAGAEGAPKKKGRDPVLGRSRGGFSSQIHILADRRGRPLCLGLTGDQCYDRTQARALVKA